MSPSDTTYSDCDCVPGHHCDCWGYRAASSPDLATLEHIARLFHEAYERLAPSFGYETRRESAVPWPDVPENNRRLMTAVVGEVRAALATLAASSGAAASPGDERLREAASEAAQYGSTLASLLTVLPGECQQVGDTCVVHDAEWSTRNGDDLGHCEWIEARTEIVPEWRSAEQALRAALDREER